MHSVGRRQFLRRAASTLGAASAFAMPWTIAARTAVGSWDETVDPETSDLIFRSNAPRNAEPKLGKLVDSWITPTPQFYIRSHGANPEIVPDRFRVSVAGLVEKPLELSVQQLIERFPAAACTCTVSCADAKGPVHVWDGIALGAWAGAAVVGTVAVILWLRPSPDTRIVAGPSSLRLEGTF